MLQSANETGAYADLIWTESKTSARRQIESNYPRLEDMIENYSSGILNLLAS
jgi:hypothetical protein